MKITKSQRTKLTNTAKFGVLFTDTDELIFQRKKKIIRERTVERPEKCHQTPAQANVGPSFNIIFMASSTD